VRRRGPVGRGADRSLPTLAERHQVIAVDLQGHGRTADIDRPPDVRLMADDIAALIGRLGLDKPDLAGYSLGGGVVFHTAAKYPDLADRLVVASATIRHGVTGDSQPRSQATGGSVAGGT
jgi:pimeloyl-ACP methyl ester carboxylesterase